jgi:hypothetical protein
LEPPAHGTSTWLPPFSQNPLLTTIRLHKYIAHCDDMLRVEISRETEDEVRAIEVATDWKVGLQLSQHDETAVKARETGYLGSGSTKIAIYVSLSGRRMMVSIQTSL